MSIIGSIGAAIRQHPIKAAAIAPAVALVAFAWKEAAENPDGAVAGALGGASNLRKIPSVIAHRIENPEETGKLAVEGGWLGGTGLLGQIRKPF